MVFDFCAGRGGRYATEFLKGWSGTLVVDAYSGYDAALSLDGRSTAYCLAHARRKFDELVKANASVVAGQAIQRIAWLYKIEADARSLSAEQRLQMRQERSQPLWNEMQVWLQLERTRVPDGSAIAKAIDYSVNHWAGLGRFLWTAMCRSTTTTSRTGSGLGPWVGAIGCSSAASWQASGPQS